MRGAPEECRYAIAHLNAIRSALEVYKADTNGKFPVRLCDLMPKYLKRIPVINLPDHSKTDSVLEVGDAEIRDVEYSVTDTGGWLYFPNPASKLYGTVALNCCHQFKSRELHSI